MLSNRRTVLRSKITSSPRKAQPIRQRQVRDVCSDLISYRVSNSALGSGEYQGKQYQVKCSLEQFMFSEDNPDHRKASAKPGQSVRAKLELDTILSGQLTSAGSGRLKGITVEHPLSRRTTRKKWEYSAGQEVAYKSLIQNNRKPNSGIYKSMQNNRSIWHNNDMIEEGQTSTQIDKSLKTFDGQLDKQIWRYEPSIAEYRKFRFSSARHDKTERPYSSAEQPEMLEMIMKETADFKVIPIKVKESNIETEITARPGFSGYQVYRDQLKSATSSNKNQKVNIYKKTFETMDFLTEEESAFMTGKGEVSETLKSAKVLLSRCRQFNENVPKGMFRPERPIPRFRSKLSPKERRDLQIDEALETHNNLTTMDMLKNKIISNKRRRSYLLHRVIEESNFDNRNPLWKNVKQNKADKDYELYRLLRHQINTNSKHL